MFEIADSETNQELNNDETIIFVLSSLFSLLLMKTFEKKSHNFPGGSLRSFNRLKIGKIDLKEKDMLAKDLVRMLEQLCSANQMEGETALNIAEIKVNHKQIS